MKDLDDIHRYDLEADDGLVLEHLARRGAWMKAADVEPVLADKDARIAALTKAGNAICDALQGLMAGYQMSGQDLLLQIAEARAAFQKYSSHRTLAP